MSSDIIETETKTIRPIEVVLRMLRQSKGSPRRAYVCVSLLLEHPETVANRAVVWAPVVSLLRAHPHIRDV
jgi:hypothetical protein